MQSVIAAWACPAARLRCGTTRIVTKRGASPRGYLNNG